MFLLTCLSRIPFAGLDCSCEPRPGMWSVSAPAPCAGITDPLSRSSAYVEQPTPPIPGMPRPGATAEWTSLPGRGDRAALSSSRGACLTTTRLMTPLWSRASASGSSPGWPRARRIAARRRSRRPGRGRVTDRVPDAGIVAAAAEELADLASRGSPERSPVAFAGGFPERVHTVRPDVGSGAPWPRTTSLDRDIGQAGAARTGKPGLCWCEPLDHRAVTPGARR